MARRSISDTERTRIFLAHQGVCAVCGGKIVGKAWDLDHGRALALLGDDTEDNLYPVHRSPCHREKTKADVARIAKAKRNETRQLGAHRSRSPLPGSRASGIRKRMNGQVERW